MWFNKNNHNYVPDFSNPRSHPDWNSVYDAVYTEMNRRDPLSRQYVFNRGSWFARVETETENIINILIENDISYYDFAMNLR